MARKFSKIEKFGLIGVAVIAVFYGYLKVVYDPAAQKLAENRTKFAGLTEEVAGYEATPSTSGVQKRIAEMKLKNGELEAELNKLLEAGKARTPAQVSLALVDLNRQIARWALRLSELAAKTVTEQAASSSGKEGKENKTKEEISGKDSLETAAAKFAWQRYQAIIVGDYAGLQKFVASLGDLGVYVLISDIAVEYREEEGDFAMRMVFLI